jgi:type IV pilus assembly protein PilA
MFQAMKRFRDERDDRGFTLIELMVVVLIIAILIAIAIPTFLGARTKAQDRAAQSDLRTALVTAQAFYTDNETYLSGADGASTATAYATEEPSITFGAAASDTTVGVYVPSSTGVVLVKQSKSDEWFCISQSTSAATVFGRAAALTDVNTAAGCAAATDW